MPDSKRMQKTFLEPGRRFRATSRDLSGFVSDHSACALKEEIGGEAEWASRRNVSSLSEQTCTRPNKEFPMKRRVIPMAAAALAMGAALIAQQPSHETQAGKNDPAVASTRSALSGFARKAATGGLAEVELGRLAAQKGSSDRVREFGQRMVEDHGKANAELQQAARDQGIDLPAEIDAKQQATIDRLSKLSGTAFDQAYMRDMVKDHEHDVAEFERAAKSGEDSPIRRFAQQTLPTLRDHLKMAKQVDGEVSGRSFSPSR
jgi:putative membrane protein